MLRLTHAIYGPHETASADLQISFQHAAILLSRRGDMDVLDGATRLGPDMDEEAQRWLETTTGNPPSAPLVSRDPQWPHTTENSVNVQGTSKQSPPPSPTIATQSRPPRTTSHNAFEARFAAEICQSPFPYDGSYAYSEGDDQTPLLDSYYQEATSASPQLPTPHSSHPAPLEPPAKSSPSLSICLWNEVSHNSQYTRPVAEMLREVLEVRYPMPSQANGHERLHGEEREAQTNSSGDEGRGKRRWWNKLLKRRVNG